MAKAEAFFAEAERAHLNRIRATAILAAPEQVSSELVCLAEAHGRQEVAALTPCHDPVARLRSYRLLAEASALAPG